MSDSKEFKDWIWTDELVAEYSLASQPLSILAFKQSKQVPVPDYEITSFRRKSTGDIEWVLNDTYNDKTFKNVCSGTKGFKLNDLIGEYRGLECATVKSGKIEIYSVKRISDSEVFCIGDETNHGVIDKFEIAESGLFVWCTNEKRTTWFYLSQIQKVKPKQPLYKTEDNWFVYEYDTYPTYKVDRLFKLLYFAACDSNGNDVGCKYFHSKEKAEQYILDNKPIQVSYKELENFYLKEYDSYPANALKEFFKLKINP